MRLPSNYAANASAFHQKVGEILCNSSLFKGYRIRQECPVEDINPNYPSGRERFDWVVLDLKLVIECHGEQHFRPTRFGSISLDKAASNLEAQRLRDTLKRRAAEEMDWLYVAISIADKELLSEQYIYDRYKALVDQFNAVVGSSKPTKPQKPISKFQQKARAYRKEQYQKLKLQRKLDGAKTKDLSRADSRR